MSILKTFVAGGALVLLIVVAVVFTGGNDRPQPVQPVDRTSGIEQEEDVYVNGIQIGDVRQQEIQGTVTSQSNTFDWENTTGQTVLVDKVLVYPDGTASSSFEVDVGTTTNGISQTTSNFSGLIDSYTFATGSQPVINSIGNGGTNGTGAIPVDSSENLSLIFLPHSDWGGLGGCNGSLCEEATSTNRGFTNMYIQFHYTRTDKL